MVLISSSGKSTDKVSLSRETAGAACALGTFAGASAFAGSEAGGAGGVASWAAACAVMAKAASTVRRLRVLMVQFLIYLMGRVYSSRLRRRVKLVRSMA